MDTKTFEELLASIKEGGMILHGEKQASRITTKEELIETLLDELDTERKKFTSADEEVIQRLVNQLVELEVYPATSKCGYSARQMVDGWGARWHIWSKPLTCPECKADWRDKESGPPFKREIGLYSDTQDRTYAFRCPDCNAEFGR